MHKEKGREPEEIERKKHYLLFYVDLIANFRIKSLARNTLNQG